MLHRLIHVQWQRSVYVTAAYDSQVGKKKPQSKNNRTEAKKTNVHLRYTVVSKFPFSLQHLTKLNHSCLLSHPGILRSA